MARPAPLTRAEFGLFRSLQTRWADIDIYGHMNNVVHYLLFDTAINGWLVEEGLLDPLSGETVGLVVESGCTYFTEITFADRIVAGIRIRRLGSSSVDYQIALFRNDEETAAAQGHFVHVYVDRVSRRPVPVPPNWRNLLEDHLRCVKPNEL